MDPVFVLTSIVAIASVIGIAILCYPNLLCIIGRHQLENGIEGGPDDISSQVMNGISEDLYAELCALGFKPAWVYWERLKFTPNKLLDFVFVSKTDNCFAALYPNNQLRPRLAGFLTTFQSGAYIKTTNSPGELCFDEPTILWGGLPLPSDNRAQPQGGHPDSLSNWRSWAHLTLMKLGEVCVVGGLVSLRNGMENVVSWTAICLGAILVVIGWQFKSVTKGVSHEPPEEDVRSPLVEVLKEHRRRVDVFVQTGHVPMKCATEEDLFELQRVIFEHPATCRLMRSVGLGVLFFKLSVLSIVPVILAFCGIQPMIVWSVVLFECFVTWTCMNNGPEILCYLARHRSPQPNKTTSKKSSEPTYQTDP